MKKKLLVLSLLTLTIGLLARPLNSFAVTNEESDYIDSLSSSCDPNSEDIFECIEEETKDYTNECENLAEDQEEGPCVIEESEDGGDDGEDIEIVDDIEDDIEEDDELVDFLSAYEDEEEEEEEMDEESVKMNIIIISAVTFASIVIIIALNLADRKK